MKKDLIGRDGLENWLKFRIHSNPNLKTRRKGKKSRHSNCKSRNVIYLRLCKLCLEKEEAYFGRTTQECHDRTSGHRNCFNETKWEKSALSMHAKDKHENNFSLKNFSIAVVKKVSPQNLRREEFHFMEKYRTIPLGLNRYKV